MSFSTSSGMLFMGTQNLIFPSSEPICSDNKYAKLEFQVAHAPEILGPAGSFSCKLMVTEGHVTFELRKDNITH